MLVWHLTRLRSPVLPLLPQIFVAVEREFECLWERHVKDKGLQVRPSGQPAGQGYGAVRSSTVLWHVVQEQLVDVSGQRPVLQPKLLAAYD